MRRKKKSENNGFNVWRSYSDMMAGVLLLFVLIMCVTLFQAQKSYNESLQERDEKIALQEEYTQELLDKQNALDKKDETLQNQDAQLKTQDEKLAEQEQQLAALAAKLKEQEVKNNDPPIFARYTSFDLLTHRKFFFLNTQLYIFLCDTFSCEKILQKNCQKCYNTQNNHHDSPVVVTCCCINYSVMIYKKETLQKNRNKNTCSNSDCCNSRCI